MSLKIFFPAKNYQLRLLNSFIKYTQVRMSSRIHYSITVSSMEEGKIRQLERLKYLKYLLNMLVVQDKKDNKRRDSPIGVSQQISNTSFTFVLNARGLITSGWINLRFEFLNQEFSIRSSEILFMT